MEVVEKGGSKSVIHFANSLLFFLCEEAKKILNSLQRNKEIVKETFTYENHLKVSKFCSPELEL